MDIPIIVILLIVWTVSGLFKSEQKKKMQSPGRIPTAPRAPGRSDPPPLRPMDVDLPGGTPTLPVQPKSERPALSLSVDNHGISPRMLNRIYGRDEASTLAPTKHVSRQSPPAAKGPSARPAATVPGLNLRFDGNAMVQGVIYGEILSRKTPRRIR